MEVNQMLYEIIDRIGKTQDEMRKILAEMQADLKYHIKRTDILEEELQRIEGRIPPPFPWKRFAVAISAISTVITAVLKIIMQV